MSFRLRADAEAWFSEIEAAFEFKFDAYYFCLMAGFSAVRSSPLKGTDTVFTDTFPGNYKLIQDLLLGGLVDCELSARGLQVSDGAAVRGAVNDLLSASGADTRLSATGAKRMNEFASGGFDELFERMADKPRRLETFLRTFAKVISDIDRERAQLDASLSMNDDHQEDGSAT